MADIKKRHVVSYEKMSAHPDLAAAFAEKYPKGFSDYLTELVKYPKPDGTFFYAVTVAGGSADASDASGETLPDDNISQYSNGADDE